VTFRPWRSPSALRLPSLTMRSSRTGAVGLTTSGHSSYPSRLTEARGSTRRSCNSCGGRGRRSIAPRGSLAGWPAEASARDDGLGRHSVTDRQWVRALTSLRVRGVNAAVWRSPPALRVVRCGASEDRVGWRAAAQQRALRLALAEYDIKAYEVHAGDNLGSVLA